MTVTNKPKSAKFKVAFTGTNSSGKTTMAMEVAARLKKDYDVLAELVSSQDRKISWKDEHFPTDPRGHFGMISNLVHAEVAAELKGDADIVVTDRSVLDLYAIATTDFPDHPMVRGMEGYIKSWLSSYDLIFYLAPLKYQEDGKRPSDDFRMKTHASLIRLMDEYELPNVVRDMSRPECFREILKLLGVERQTNPVYAADAKWGAIARELGVSLLVKEPKWSSTSDQDVWLILDNFAQFENGALVTKAKTLVETYFGRIDADFMTVPREALTSGLPAGTFKSY